jgi:hypothetical protein
MGRRAHLAAPTALGHRAPRSPLGTCAHTHAGHARLPLEGRHRRPPPLPVTDATTPTCTLSPAPYPVPASLPKESFFFFPISLPPSSSPSCVGSRRAEQSCRHRSSSPPPPQVELCLKPIPATTRVFYAASMSASFPVGALPSSLALLPGHHLLELPTDKLLLPG